MGAGLALQIRRKWPHVYNDYRKAFHKGLLFLGNVIISEACSGLDVAHLCGQDRYGKKPGRVYTNYRSLAACFRMLASIDKDPIYLPYGIGCGFAGGNWEVVNKLINKFLPNAIIVKLG